jgi:hypothetical protein
MQPGNDKLVADRIFEVLSQKYTKSKEMIAPATNLTGRWDVEMEFYSSKSNHTFFIEQDGNWIQGSHKGEFSVRDLVGTIEGDQIKFNSADSQIADHIPFLFSGTVSGEKMSGQIYMGEYINAKFTATRYHQKAVHKKILLKKQMLPY